MSQQSLKKEIPSKYDPTSVEDKWYSYWMENGYFHSTPDERPSYTIVIPPPNVTGVLHMGHMLNNTIQDVLIRKARMSGFNACWVPGTDHASIATEAKVVRKLREEGIKKGDLSRDDFLEHAWEWTHKHGGIILEQLKKLGASCDWDRTAFTMDPDYYDAVINVFVDLHKKGYIYRGERMINWDPSAKTALSDEEVIFKEVNSKLYHIRYQIAGSEDEYVTIATTRPETILGDTALCCHPDDERYQHLKGKKAIVPLVNREVPIIFDEYVEMEFGTGCLKVTPAHDVNDFDLGEKYNLEIIDIMNPDGTLSEAAQLYVGEDRFKVRKLIAKDLEAAGNLVEIEDYRNKVGYSERTDVVIEPRLSLQWWVSMEKLSKPAFENVMNDNVQFHPSKFKNSYRNWMENIKDWCISRQLWWGQRIPAYYYGEGEHDYVIATSIEEAIKKASTKTGNSVTANALKQDEDVLDTWFSSWLWPIAVFNGFKDRKEVDYYYPTADLVTAPEIMFFWVARMIIAGYEYMGEKPFSNVYYTGIVRDLKGRKMSKSLGNSPDPLDLIAHYGADGVRVGMLFASPAGNDLLFDEKLCEQGRNFSNKIWNAFRFLTMNMEEGLSYDPNPNFDQNSLVDRWMAGRIHQTVNKIDEDFANYRPNDALKKIYSLVWDDFADWYIELIKPADYTKKIPKNKLEVALGFFEQLMKILHPFMPFISEEIWQYIKERSSNEALIVADWPKYNPEFDRQDDINEFQLIQKLVSAIRNIRAESNISPKEELDVLIHTKTEKVAEILINDQWIFKHLQKIGKLTLGEDLEKPKACATAIVEGHEVWIPLEGHIDTDKEVDRIEKEIQRLEGFLKGINGKLNNSNFVDNAPEAVVEKERKKQQDTEQNLATLRKQLEDLA